MGYFSDVGVALKKSDWIRMQDAAAHHEAFPDSDFLDLWDGIEERGSDVVLTRTNSKWYETFPEINFVMKFLSTIEHEFVRLGEDIGDLESENTFKDGRSYFCVEQKLCLNQVF